MLRGGKPCKSGRVGTSFVTVAAIIVALVGLAAGPALAVKRADPLPIGRIPPGHAYRTTVMTPEVTFTNNPKAAADTKTLDQIVASIKVTAA